MAEERIQQQRLYRVNWEEKTGGLQTSYFYGPSMEDVKSQFVEWYQELYDKEFKEDKNFAITREQKG